MRQLYKSFLFMISIVLASQCLTQNSVQAGVAVRLSEITGFGGGPIAGGATFSATDSSGIAPGATPQVATITDKEIGLIVSGSTRTFTVNGSGQALTSGGGDFAVSLQNVTITNNSLVDAFLRLEVSGFDFTTPPEGVERALFGNSRVKTAIGEKDAFIGGEFTSATDGTNTPFATPIKIGPTSLVFDEEDFSTKTFAASNGPQLVSPSVPYAVTSVLEVKIKAGRTLSITESQASVSADPDIIIQAVPVPNSAVLALAGSPFLAVFLLRKRRAKAIATT